MKSVKIVTRVSRPKVACSKVNEIYAVICIQPPPAKETTRKPLDLAVVLDSSGSMGRATETGSKLTACKDSIRKLIDFLESSDRMGLVHFEDRAETLQHLTDLNPANRKKFHNAVHRNFGGGLTDLHGGLMQGLALIEKKDPNRIRHCLLFTDGFSNAGRITEAPRIAEDIRKRFPDEDIGISCFGYGEHDAAAMKALLRRGNYYHIKDVETIAKAFGTEFGTLTSIYDTGVTVALSAPDSVASFEVINPLNQRQEASATVVELPDLLAGAPYNLVVKVTLKASRPKREASSHPILFGKLTLSSNIVHCEAKCQRGLAREASKKDDPKVMEVVAVQEAARAQREAIKAADKGDFAGARMSITKSADAFKSYNPTMARMSLSSVSNFTDEKRYKSAGAGQAASLSNTLSRQVAGTAGATYGDVDVDEVFASPSQQAGAKMFSIKRKDKKDGST